ncbi:hypothetical protein LVJ94_33195 [Pendulispora rubella]|uniref:Uncharacterized protein n=1 Tax=Pendulispora rubella TaxID=2741070 RepID=A0ABZ2KT96_9BACT
MPMIPPSEGSSLPTFADLLRYARRQLQDAEEILRLPWQGAVPTREQVDALEEARTHIAAAHGILRTAEESNRNA